MEVASALLNSNSNFTSLYVSDMPVRRTPRPNNVQFRVGQVVKHKKLGYRAVIIGWDPKARVSLV